MRAVVAAWLALLVALPSAAAAQPGLGLGRDLGDPGAPAEEPEAGSDPADGGEAGEGDDEEWGPWPGPQLQIGYAYSKLADGYGGGDTHTAAFEVFVHWPISELRTGVYAALGARDVNLGGADFFVRGGASVGFQLTELIDPLVPHVAALFSAGAVVGERFDSTVAYGFAGGGIELGAALRMVRNLHLHVAFSYQRLEMDGAAFDLFEFRVGFGL